MHNEYFEGILQLRNPTDEILEYIDKELEKKGNVFITKRKKLKNGWDLYFTDQHFLQVLGKKLKQNFSGEIIVSSSLFSRNHLTGKEVHRVNVLFRHVDANPGDEVVIRGDRYKVIKLGEKVNAKNVETGKKAFLSYEDLSTAQ